MNWLVEALSKCSLTEDVEGYLLGRGAKPETIQALGCVTWCNLEKPHIEEVWQKRYGKDGRGSVLAGHLIVPLYSPRGAIIGFEARATDRKEVSRYLLPEAEWNPVWAGLYPAAMERIWNRGDVWIVEGIFDVFPMEWIVPPTDVVLGSLRAKVTDTQVEFLRRFCRGWVHVVYDRDETGKKGTHGWVDETGKRRWGALDRLVHAGVRCREVLYTGGKDPGELWDHFGRNLKQKFAL